MLEISLVFMTKKVFLTCQHSSYSCPKKITIINSGYFCYYIQLAKTM